MAEQFYFAYGSNMNLDQMQIRCPAATVVENVRLEDYRLAFRGRNQNSGVATILPEKGSHVDGVLWKITGACEAGLDQYEGFPYLYGKQKVRVKGKAEAEYESMVYVMNAPYRECPATPSGFYLNGILDGCSQNDLDIRPVKEAVLRTEQEVEEAAAGKLPKRKNGPER